MKHLKLPKLSLARRHPVLQVVSKSTLKRRKQAAIKRRQKKIRSLTIAVIAAVYMCYMIYLLLAVFIKFKF